jgi:hypothetical protein
MRPLTHRPPRSFAKYVLFVLTVGLVAALATIGATGTVGAGVDQVCPDLDTGHIDGNNQTSITITAPEGKVIVQVCVKAGSAQQGDGPEITNFNPGVTETTISHSSGKEISHYSVKFADAPPPPPNGTAPPNGTVPPPEVKQPPPPRAPSAAAPVPGVPRVTG